VAAYYYLRIIVVMYFHEPGEASDTIGPMATGVRVALFASVVATLVLGIFPSYFINYAGQSSNLMIR
jgi:NADH-quinone oxidoreductase subunit N